MRAKTSSTRRMGVENSQTRAQLVDAAARLIREEGCAAVTARRLAEELGLKRQIIHYYFGTIEELFVAVIRQSVGKLHDRARQTLESDEPLRVIWQMGHLVKTTIFEFSAMAMRRKAIKAEMKHYMEEFRKIQSEAIARHLEVRGIKPAIPPVVTAIVINSISHILAVENALDVSLGHAETKALMEHWLRVFAEQGELPAGCPAAGNPAERLTSARRRRGPTAFKRRVIGKK